MSDTTIDPKRHWLWFGVLAAVLVAGAISAFFAWKGDFYHRTAFRGDGTITDSGFWSYPRYMLTLPRVSLTEPGEHRFAFSGLPGVPMTFSMRLTRTDLPGLSETQPGSLSNSVDVKLVDDKGRTVFATSGPLRGWTQMQSSNGLSYWQPSSRDLPISRYRSYTLDIVVTNDRTDGQPVSVEPCLAGGGNELP